jgi:hypothetical protein
VCFRCVSPCILHVSVLFCSETKSCFYLGYAGFSFVVGALAV